jgi:hypothetical protein
MIRTRRSAVTWSAPARYSGPVSFIRGPCFPGPPAGFRATRSRDGARLAASGDNGLRVPDPRGPMSETVRHAARPGPDDRDTGDDATLIARSLQVPECFGCCSTGTHRRSTGISRGAWGLMPPTTWSRRPSWRPSGDPDPDRHQHGPAADQDRALPEHHRVRPLARRPWPPPLAANTRSYGSASSPRTSSWPRHPAGSARCASPAWRAQSSAPEPCGV